MPSAPPREDLTAKLLIAMPDMGDPRFHGSVVFLCAHSADGAMGLIVNKPMRDVRFADMLDQLDIQRGAATPNMPVCYGGPVELRRGFVLHSAEYRGRQDDRLDVDAGFAMTATIDVLEDLARGAGPDRALMALGYAGWGPGQIEDEIGQNGWLTADATPDLVFGPRMEGKWAAALASLGISPLTLSSEAGRA
ncbi:YqgE/AlgH family protein [Roseicyclus mahoneyensis]|uniref:UPF0301 protein C7455_106162 n=1 Tax=Roseicyclus mahoneyensis TaxID=164332 RepID=A0A316GG68_9RHOB|nr:YqgE/AlgH family protein [Roseicyclus mahoneyensis]PWK59874.1 putative transcriptional regulator [Roseicyclus mahoneyensis]